MINKITPYVISIIGLKPTKFNFDKSTQNFKPINNITLMLNFGYQCYFLFRCFLPPW